MPTSVSHAAVVTEPEVGLAEYAQLKARVRETLVLGQQRIEEARVFTYWRAGWYIRTHVALQSSRAERYGAKVLERLGRDLDVDVTVLRRCVQFVERLPKLFSPEEIRATWRESPLPGTHAASRAPLLTWSHYRELLTVTDAAQRSRLLQEATRQEWPVVELQARVRRITARTGASESDGAPQLLTPKRGTPGLFRITELDGRRCWDLGFESYRALSEAEQRRFAVGDRVRLAGDGRLEPAPEAKAEELYGYEARVLRVIDGDTFWMLIRLAGPDWRREKLRLRGIDCPERDTPAGAAAKRFVEAQLRRAAHLTITTTKPDQWDRYLSDVWLTTESGEVTFLNNHLLTIGHARRYDAVSPTDWEP